MKVSDVADGRSAAASSTTTLAYQTGFGNEFATEALAGALPVGRNSPQRPPKGLYPEVLSGTAFTAPRAENRSSWLYKLRPSAMHGPYRMAGVDEPVEVCEVAAAGLDALSAPPGSEKAQRWAASDSAPTAPQFAAPLLAVLAFDNLSTDPEMQFFSDGVSEEIIQRVSRGPRRWIRSPVRPPEVGFWFGNVSSSAICRSSRSAFARTGVPSSRKRTYRTVRLVMTASNDR